MEGPAWRRIAIVCFYSSVVEDSFASCVAALYVQHGARFQLNHPQNLRLLVLCVSKHNYTLQHLPMSRLLITLNYGTGIPTPSSHSRDRHDATAARPAKEKAATQHTTDHWQHRILVSSLD